MYGTHFIVLIDDSRDMGDATRQQQIAAAVPTYLFGNRGTQETDYPIFDPDHDHLTMLFFAVYGSDASKRNGCAPGRRSSVAPDQLFEAVDVGDIHSADELKAFLGVQLAKACRFKGYLSPIALSELLALPFVQSKLEPNVLFQRTGLLLVSNLRYNLSASPSGELAALTQIARQEKEPLEGSDEAIELTKQVVRDFELDPPKSAFIAVDRNGGLSTTAESANVWLHPIEVKPLPDSGFWYPKSVTFEREAISSTEIRLVPASGDPAELRIPITSRLNPIAMQQSYTGTSGSTLAIGQRELAATTRIDLTDCPPGSCRREADTVIVPILDESVPLVLTRSHPDTITSTLFVAMALIESTAIYALVISLILIFANPFWAQVTG